MAKESLITTNLVQVVAPGSISEEVEEEKTEVEPPEISYSDTVKNRANGEMTGLAWRLSRL